MNYEAYIHNEDLDRFIDFVKNIGTEYVLVYKLQSLPYTKIQVKMTEEDMLAAKLIFSDSDTNFHQL